MSEEMRPTPEDMEFSDAFHAMPQLYGQRGRYHPLLDLLEGFRSGTVVKSWKCHDGEPCFGYTAAGTRWFIVTMYLSSEVDQEGQALSRVGRQVTQHYPEAMWDAFRIPSVEVAPVWDGHDAEEGNRRTRDFVGLWDQEAQG